MRTGVQLPPHSLRRASTRADRARACITTRGVAASACDVCIFVPVPSSCAATFTPSPPAGCCGTPARECAARHKMSSSPSSVARGVDARRCAVAGQQHDSTGWLATHTHTHTHTHAPQPTATTCPPPARKTSMSVERLALTFFRMALRRSSAVFRASPRSLFSLDTVSYSARAAASALRATASFVCRR